MLFHHQAGADHVKEVFGAVAPPGSAEQKLRKKREKLVYGQQLQEQMKMQEEMKKRERMERMGIPVPTQGQAMQPRPFQMQQPADVNSPAFAPNQPAGMSPAFNQEPGALQPSQQPINYSPIRIPAAPYNHQQPAWNPAMNDQQTMAQIPMQGMPYSQQTAPFAHMPAQAQQYGGGQLLPAMLQQGFQAGFAEQQQLMQQQQQQPLWGNNNYGYDQQYQNAGRANDVRQPLGVGLPGHGSSSYNNKVAQKAQQDAYRLELEAQIRAKAEQKRAEKEASRQEVHDRQAAFAARDYAAAMNRMGAAVPMQYPQPQPYMQPADQYPIREQQPQAPYMAIQPMPVSPSANRDFGIAPNFPPQPILQPPDPQSQGPSYYSDIHGPTGGVMPSAQPGEQLGVANPNFRFRSDNAFLTPAEIDSKARQKAELQEALERQIAEKRQRKEAEKAAQAAEVASEEARLRHEQDRLRNQYAQERAKEDNKDGEIKEDKVAAAWAKAKAESEQSKKRHFDEKRVVPPAGIMQDTTGMPSSFSHEQPVMSDMPPMQSRLAVQQSTDWPAAPPAQQQPAMPLQPFHQQPPPSTPLAVAVDRVKKMAEQEVQKVRAELQAEAAHLHTIVEQQGAQVAALRQHADTMEHAAHAAQAQVTKLHVDLIRSSMAAPESLMHIMSDYPAPVQSVPPSLPPNMLDIALDLPPPAAVQRRAIAASQPIYDMGPLIPPVHNPHDIDPVLQRTFLATPGREHRPPTQGLRTINPLEASLAAESVLIYPAGRDLTAHAKRAVKAGSPAARDLPFQSLVMAPGQLMVDQQSSTLLGQQNSSITSQLFSKQSLQHPSKGLTVDTSIPSPTANTMLQQSSVMLSPGKVRAALGGGEESPPRLDDESSQKKHQTTMLRDKAVNDIHSLDITDTSIQLTAITDKGHDQSNLSSPGSTMTAAAGMQSAQATTTVLQTPLDMESLNHQNQEKLNMLQELTAMSTADNVANIDAFLAKFSKQRRGLPERTRTPVIRVGTPTAVQHDSNNKLTVLDRPSFGRRASSAQASNTGHSEVPGLTGEMNTHLPLRDSSRATYTLNSTQRIPSYGRRASSAQSNVNGLPPPAHTPPRQPLQHALLGSGEPDALDVEVQRMSNRNSLIKAHSFKSGMPSLGQGALTNMPLPVAGTLSRSGSGNSGKYTAAQQL